MCENQGNALPSAKDPRRPHPRQLGAAWLAKNHATVSEIWLVFHKVHTGKPTISYEDAVDEALCYGWVDSLIKRLDDNRYARKFTPRKPDSPLVHDQSPALRPPQSRRPPPKTRPRPPADRQERRHAIALLKAARLHRRRY